MSSPEERLIEVEDQLEEARSRLSQLQQSLEVSNEARRSAEQQLEICQQNAKAAVEEMDHIIYAVGHDLRQPLRAVLTNAQMIQRTVDQNQLTQESCSLIVEGALEINHRIERMLTFSRTASNLRLSVVPLSAVVQMARLTLEPLITKNEAKITDDNLPVAEVDDSALSSLFREVLTNSILYRGAASPEISVSAEPFEDNHLISVRDNGVGISPEFHERVFRPFARLHGPEIPGFGLGLAIARKVVRAHGGKIWVESDGQSGSTVRFTIPG